MLSGVYFVIEYIEVMYVIDVNSGYKMGSLKQEDIVMWVNLEVVEEIVWQLCFWDIGGIIIIDFIDMCKAEQCKEFVKAMWQFMKKDCVQYMILFLSKFGLMQIICQWVWLEVNISIFEVCLICNGIGKINVFLLIYDEIECDLNFIVQFWLKLKIKLLVYFFIEVYFKKGFLSV